MYDGICDAIHREMDALDEKYSTGKTPMNSQDLEMIDKMAHTMKSLKAYEAMVDGDYYSRGRGRVRYDDYPKGDYRRY